MHFKSVVSMTHALWAEEASEGLIEAMAGAKTFPNCSSTLRISIFLGKECSRPNSNLGLKFTHVTISERVSAKHRCRVGRILQHFIPKYCCLSITTGWLTVGGRGKTTKQTNPKSELETEDAKGHRSSHCWKKELQDSPNSVAMLHSFHLQVSVHNVFTHEARFQPCLLTAINAGRKTETGLLYLQTSPRQAKVYFSRVAVIKSLSVDMSMISRLMLSTSSQTDEWGINTKIKLVILHVFPLISGEWQALGHG